MADRGLTISVSLMSNVSIIIVIISHQITGFAIHQYWNDDDDG